MKISRQVREILEIVVFLVVVGALLTTFVIYPLNRSKAVMGRNGIDEYSEDSVLVNDPAAWIEAGLAPDTFWLEADGLTTLACLYLLPDSSIADSIKGTVFLIHDDAEDRNSMIPLARQFVGAGYAVVAYDQRASGFSSGKYRGDGQYEAADLEALVPHLDLRERIVHPLLVVGYSLGGDAAILAALEDKRIDAVAAVNPYLTTRRMQDILKERHNTFWFPFCRTMMWWWYNIRSSYAAPYRDVEDIKPVACPTILFTPSSAADQTEVRRIVELSDPQLLKQIATPVDDEALFHELLSFINRLE